MRKLIPIMVAVVMVVAVGVPGISQDNADPVTPSDFERIIDFEGSIQTLAELVTAQEYDRIDTQRYFILEGSVASTQVFDPNPESFQAIIELVSSRWIGLEEIEVYHAYVLVEDPRYAPRLPERLPREPGPEIIQPNQKLLVVGPFIGTALLEPNVEVPVVQAVALR